MKQLFLAAFLCMIVLTPLIGNTQVSALGADTCSAFNGSLLPGAVNNVYVIGDSRLASTNAQSYMTSQFGLRGLTVEDPSFNDTIPGLRVNQYMDDEFPGANTFIANADVIYVNLGVNNWNDVVNFGISTVEGYIDTFISSLKTINPDVVIVWQEDYVHETLVLADTSIALSSRQGIVDATPQIAEYQRELDSEGTICLVPWATQATADPTPYTTATPVADGVHMYGNETTYVDAFLQYLDTIEGLDDDADGIVDSEDNCLAFANPGQTDSDSDGAGDDCDTDKDGDNILDASEDLGPNGGDANNDGTMDSVQSTVTTLTNPVTSDFAVLDATSSNCIANNAVSLGLEQTDISLHDSEFNYPAGLLSFTLTGCDIGEIVTVTHRYYGVEYSSLADLSLRKYNSTDNTYAEVSGAIFSEETVAGEVILKIIYQVTDGGALDEDGQMNGTIVDPAGPAVLADNGTVSLAETGNNTLILLVVGTILVGLTVKIERSVISAYYKLV